ncbi:hypothetical protein HDU67_008366 [Dinochytrium kinnereticum]|nr:hypothetical protein HDU67_008366 [Dinochytrium kinnereticum]
MGFLSLHEYLERTYPLVHTHLKRHVLAKFSLAYIWEGSQHTDNPLMLCAHMDVVPVLNDTLSQWTHQPWSGFIDEESGFIWGRGSVDTKNTMIAILEAGEALLRGGYKPKRSIIFAFGHDEEVSGYQGAAHISSFLINELGLENKVGMVIDEGPTFRDLQGTEYALVSVAEKGYYDVEVNVHTKGGHSSLPPDHTAIGMLSEAIVALESNPHPLSLPMNSPHVQTLQCVARHSPKLSWAERFAIERISLLKPAVLTLLGRDKEMRYLMKTSQAIDVIRGGHKVNALPEVATAAINHRIAFDSSSTAVENRMVQTLKPIAARNGLDLKMIPSNKSKAPIIIHAKEPVGTIEIRAFRKPLEPSPLSPTFGHPAWEVLAGTIHHALSPPSDKTAKPFGVTPLLMPANTDTRHYWKLTKNIYRWGPFRGGEGYHTVNERLPIDSLIEGVIFFHELIRNWDEI